MGMFDTVRFRCPSCKYIIEQQSKAGPSVLNVYELGEAPLSILHDLFAHHNDMACSNCDHPIQFEWVTLPILRAS